MSNLSTLKCKFCGAIDSLSHLRENNKGNKDTYGSIYYNLTMNETRPFPKTLYGIKATLGEKNKAFLMLDKIQSDFNITDWDIKKWREEILNKEIVNIEELTKQAESNEKKKPFTRDEYGQIKSPFASKRKLYK